MSAESHQHNERGLLDALTQAHGFACYWQDDRRQLVEQRLGVADVDDPRIVDDAEYKQVMDAAALIGDALHAVKKLTAGATGSAESPGPTPEVER